MQCFHVCLFVSMDMPILLLIRDVLGIFSASVVVELDCLLLNRRHSAGL